MNFLVYHELEKAPPPGEKKRAMKRKRSDAGLEELDPQASQRPNLEEEWTDDDRRLMGSPQDNYGWKTGGLVKKTYSFDFRGASHHIISYFNPDDVRSGELKRPIHCREFEGTYIRPELIDQGARSRNPITEAQVEQQRWEPPLYHADGSPTLMRQYPLQAPNAYAPPTPALDFHGRGAATAQQPPQLVHRSSIHFPVEDHIYTPNPADPYAQHVPRANVQSRHMSISAAAATHNGYARHQVPDSLTRGGLDFSKPINNHYPTPLSTHSRGPASLTDDQVDAKATPLPEEDTHDLPYHGMTPQHSAYVVASPPNMHTVDTSYSHTVARPSLFHGPHSTTDIHPPNSLMSAVPPPAAKKGRINTPTFQNLDHHRSNGSGGWEQQQQRQRAPSIASVGPMASAHEVVAGVTQADFPTHHSLPTSQADYPTPHHHLPTAQADFSSHHQLPMDSFTFAPPTQSDYTTAATAAAAAAASHVVHYSPSQDHQHMPGASYMPADDAPAPLQGILSYTNYSPLTAPS